MYACAECGATYSKWQGQCAHCGQWNTIAADTAQPSRKKGKQTNKAHTLTLRPLVDIEPSEALRFSSTINEVDRVLGGGFVAGSALLLGGQPGAGKSTLILQILTSISHHTKALYISGEESVAQIALRAERMGQHKSRLPVVATTDVEAVADLLAKEQPTIAVVDSIQMMNSAEVASPAGSVSQVRTCANILIALAKQHNICLLLIGHVTKEGNLAGPKVLEHCVDASLLLETMTDSRYRSLRVYKNRFGAVGELGIFAMLDSGMKPVTNPSALFLSGGETSTPGTVTTVVREGNLPLLLEVQALVGSQTPGNFHRQVCVGVDNTRLAMLLAVCDRHIGISFASMDIFVNVVGGMKVAETATDLAIIAALVSSIKNTPIAKNKVLFGEVGLTGEVRPVAYGQERLQEAAKHGFAVAYIATKNAPSKSTPKVPKVITVGRVAQLLDGLYDN